MQQVRAPRSPVAVALAVYLLALAFVMLAPNNDLPSAMVAWLERRLIDVGFPPPMVHYDRLEVLMNVMITVPVGLLGGLLVPGWTWRDWTGRAFAVSTCVEAFQSLFSDRDVTLRDVGANTLGVMVGALLAAGVRRWRDRRTAGAGGDDPA